MRCDARNQVPCSRCRSTGRDCILDPIEGGARRRTAAGRHRTPVFDHTRWVLPCFPAGRYTCFLGIVTVLGSRTVVDIVSR